jgi:hypothetical protein
MKATLTQKRVATWAWRTSGSAQAYAIRYRKSREYACIYPVCKRLRSSYTVLESAITDGMDERSKK